MQKKSDKFYRAHQTATEIIKRNSSYWLFPSTRIDQKMLFQVYDEVVTFPYTQCSNIKNQVKIEMSQFT